MGGQYARKVTLRRKRGPHVVQPGGWGGGGGVGVWAMRGGQPGSEGQQARAPRILQPMV